MEQQTIVISAPDEHEGADTDEIGPALKDPGCTHVKGLRSLYRCTSCVQAAGVEAEGDLLAAGLSEIGTRSE